MRRAIAALAVAIGLLAVGVTPAYASRDPFHPLVSQSTSTTSTGATSTANGSTAASQTGSQGSARTGPTTTSQPTDASPNTGFDASMWAALAVALMLVGGGLIVIARLLGPGAPASVTR